MFRFSDGGNALIHVFLNTLVDFVQNTPLLTKQK